MRVVFGAVVVVAVGLAAACACTRAASGPKIGFPANGRDVVVVTGTEDPLVGVDGRTDVGWFTVLARLINEDNTGLRGAAIGATVGFDLIGCGAGVEEIVTGVAGDPTDGCGGSSGSPAIVG